MQRKDDSNKRIAELQKMRRSDYAKTWIGRRRIKIEIEKIRGVNSDRSVNKLVELELVKEVGRLDAPGRPMLFGTTEDFLRSFGVQSIDELPTISEDMVEQYKEEAELELASESFDADNQEDSDGQITLGI